MIEYISFSALNVFRSSPEKYFLQYICTERPPRQPQTLPMAMGSAFDAYIKTYLLRKIGKDAVFDDLFESHVEPQNRDGALEWGGRLFASYRKSGALDALLTLINRH